MPDRHARSDLPKVHSHRRKRKSKYLSTAFTNAWRSTVPGLQRFYALKSRTPRTSVALRRPVVFSSKEMATVSWHVQSCRCYARCCLEEPDASRRDLSPESASRQQPKKTGMSPSNVNHPGLGSTATFLNLARVEAPLRPCLLLCCRRRTQPRTGACGQREVNGWRRGIKICPS